MLLTTLTAENDSPDDEFAENSSEILDRIEDTEPAENEGEKMAQRIWDKVMEQMPIETRQGSHLVQHEEKCCSGT